MRGNGGSLERASRRFGPLLIPGMTLGMKLDITANELSFCATPPGEASTKQMDFRIAFDDVRLARVLPGTPQFTFSRMGGLDRHRPTHFRSTASTRESTSEYLLVPVVAMRGNTRTRVSIKSASYICGPSASFRRVCADARSAISAAKHFNSRLTASEEQTMQPGSREDLVVHMKNNATNDSDEIEIGETDTEVDVDAISETFLRSTFRLWQKWIQSRWVIALTASCIEVQLDVSQSTCGRFQTLKPHSLIRLTGKEYEVVGTYRTRLALREAGHKHVSLWSAEELADARAGKRLVVVREGPRTAGLMREASVIKISSDLRGNYDAFRRYATHSVWTGEADLELMRRIQHLCATQGVGPFDISPQQLLERQELARSLPTLVRYMRQNLRNDLPMCTSVRFAMIVNFNLLLRRSLVFLDFGSCLRRTSAPLTAQNSRASAANLVLSVRHLVFFDIKVSIWQQLLERTKTHTPDGDDEFSVPQEVQEVQVERNYASKLTQHTDITVQRRAALFAQAHDKLGDIRLSRLRQTWSNASNPQPRAFRVKFFGEGVVDQGGPYRALFTDIMEELQTKKLLHLFVAHKGLAEDDVDGVTFNSGAVSQRDLSMFRFFGHLLGVAIRCGIQLNLRLPSFFWKRLTGHQLGSFEVREVDLELHRQLQSIMQVTSQEDLDELMDHSGFCISTFDTRTIDLLPMGQSIRVTMANRTQYVALASNFRLRESNQQMEVVVAGLSDILPVDHLSLFSWTQLRDVVCGVDDLDIGMLRSCTKYESMSPDNACVQHFWAALESFSSAERISFLQFTCARNRLPVTIRGGVFEGENFTIKPLRPSPDSTCSPDDLLPKSQTCFFTLMLPAYSSKAIASLRIRTAIKMCKSMDADVALRETEIWRTT